MPLRVVGTDRRSSQSATRRCRSARTASADSGRSGHRCGRWRPLSVEIPAPRFRLLARVAGCHSLGRGHGVAKIVRGDLLHIATRRFAVCLALAAARARVGRTRSNVSRLMAMQTPSGALMVLGDGADRHRAGVVAKSIALLAPQRRSVVSDSPQIPMLQALQASLSAPASHQRCIFRNSVPTRP